MLAVENFGYSSGALNGLSVGIGWAGPWQVQNGSVAVPGYNVSSTTPLTAAGTAQSGGYAVGGLNYQTSGRSLDASATGPFAPYVSAGLIGKSGTSLFFSFLMRQDKNTNDEISLTLHPGGSPAWAVSSPGVQVGYFGGTRFWGLKLDGVVRPTKIPVVTGQAALMVVRIDFAATSTVSLYVNPSLTALPTAASVAATTTKSIAFQSLAYYGGPASGESSVDEIRFSGTYLGLGLKSIAPPSAPTGLTATPGNTQVSLAWTAVSGATSYKVYAGVAGGTAQLQSTQTTTAFTVGGLTNSVGYSFYVVAMNATGTGPVSATVNATPRGVAPTPHPTLGTNLAELKDYSRSWPMVDAFKMARPWISQLQGASWGGGPALALDANGWIKSLAPGQYAETIIFDNGLDDQVRYPTGNYTLLYDGEGTVAFDLNSASIVSQTPGRMVVNVPGAQTGIFLMVTATNPANPIRNIRFIMPGFESTYLTQPFHPLFLSRLQGYKALRFMEWGLINGSTLQNWADRPQPADYSYVWRGVPVDVMIQLANATGLTPWFNVPAQASDDYVTQLATLVQSKLKPGLKYYVEYSNETWNGAFSQNGYMKAQGLQLGLSADPTLAVAYYTAYRSVQIFRLFRNVVGTSAPMVRVIASQAANSWLSDQTLGFQNAFASADALAIAPYFNCSDTGGFGMLGDPATAALVDAMSVDQVIDVELAHINGCTMAAMTSNSTVAKKYGLLMVGYEGGQSLVGFNGAENDAIMTGLFKAANRSPRMNALYTQYLNNWVAAGGDLLIHFNDVSAETKYGSWGALEYQDQDPGTSPKYQALMNFSTLHP